MEYKRHAREHSNKDRLLTSVPATRVLLERLAERGGNLGSAVAALGRLLDHHGQAELERAVQTALEHGGAHPGAVRQILEGRRHERGLPQPVAIPVPEKVRHLAVRPHSLSDYDRLSGKEKTDA